MDAGVEGFAHVFHLTQALGQYLVAVLDQGQQRGIVVEMELFAVVAGRNIAAWVAMFHVHQTRIGGQRGHLTDVGGTNGVHQGGFATFKGAENNQIGLLLFHFVEQALQAQKHVGKARHGPPQHLGIARALAGGAGHLQSRGEGLEDTGVGLAEFVDIGFNGREGSRGIHGRIEEI